MLRSLLALIFVTIFLILSIPIWGFLSILGLFNKKAKDVIGRYPELKGIYVTTGTPMGAAKAVEESRKPIQMVVFDHSQEIFRYIRKGIIAAAIGQDPFGQGHDPIIYMYNSIVTGQPLPSTNMKCRLNVVDRSNVDSLLDM